MQSGEDKKARLVIVKAYISHCREELHKYEQVYKDIQKEIEESCDHDWDIDRSDYYHTHYICNKCNAFRL